MATKADSKVDKLYAGLRGRYGPSDSRANGYRLQTYFLREQELILNCIEPEAEYIVDIGCGSGLMILPSKHSMNTVIGLDYNEEACLSSLRNGLFVIRGNAFSLPLLVESINIIVNCQFLNQQSHESALQLLKESFNVLKPGGKIILVWRNGDALIHKVAHFIYSITDKIIRKPTFPNVNHDLAMLSKYAVELGFVPTKQAVVFPLLKWQSEKTTGFISRLIGASNFLILKKP